MLTKLRLEQFKNFEDSSLILGPLTVLIGTNASGKSNIRDAFRFLHGISRGYSLAEIMGEKYIEGGVLQWQGIRGGTRESTYLRANTFTLTIELIDAYKAATIYSIEVKPGTGVSRPEIVKESLHVDDMRIFRYPCSDKKCLGVDIAPVNIYQPLLTQIAAQQNWKAKSEINCAKEMISAINSMRFLDLSPNAMRQPSFPGQTVLGDRGENLSSVLQTICEDSRQKQALVEWIRELTPMDASDFEFVADQTGRILLTLVEESGRKTSIYSASDGTLRFLAMIAALFGPETSQFYFFEEMENGLHPARLHLLLQLMERKASEGKIQIVATTHSPQLLRFLDKNTHKHTSLLYRLPDTSEGRIRRITDIPDVQRLIEEQDIAELHESGWFEDAMFFLDDTEYNRIRQLCPEVAELEGRIR
ncbi:MAG: AAA family ATPase [Desulfobacteraceae bacterium]|nr:AAA family ATPase [Desulfobacteraceae bacterium]